MPGRPSKYPDSYRATITLSRKVWTSAARKAKATGVSVSEIINGLLAEWTAKK